MEGRAEREARLGIRLARVSLGVQAVLLFALAVAALALAVSSSQHDVCGGDPADCSNDLAGLWRGFLGFGIEMVAVAVALGLAAWRLGRHPGWWWLAVTLDVILT